MTSSSIVQSTSTNKTYIISVTIIGIFFFIFGFVTWLNSILIPYLKIACEINDLQTVFVTFAFYISYTLMALPSSWILKKTGFRKGMSAGLIVMALGSLVFIPAAMSRTYGLFLTGLFIMGTGLAILQTASNPYITIIGPRETAARRISIMGICNKLAGVIAPLILAYFIFNDGDAFIRSLEGMEATARASVLDGLASRVIGPYIVMSVVLILLGLLILIAPLPEVEAEKESAEELELVAGKTNIFQFPHLILGVITLFFYVGIEVIAIDYSVPFGQAINVAISSAKYFPSLVLTGMVIGYILGIFLIPKILSQKNLLIISAISGLIFTLLAIFIPAAFITRILFFDPITFQPVDLVLPYSIIFIALLGVSNAIVWPAIWPLAIHGLGRFIKTGSALLIMGIAGGALMPMVWRKLADAWSAQEAYWIAIPCYLFILYYAVYGHKVKRWK